MPVPTVVVHGGATVFKEQYHEDIVDAVSKAALVGDCVLDKGGTAVDAVEAAVWTLEETELFTAGRGACENLDGEIEVDASIMDGNRLQSGAVMAVRDIVHPISLARYVLERMNVMQVVGQGANKLYDKMVQDGFRTESERGRTSTIPIAQGCDTVGAVAVDENGRLAAASSTSGWPGKLSGRVGDSPIIGAGIYANDTTAVTCTGKGEQILRIVMARRAGLFVEDGQSVRDSVELVMKLLREQTSGQAGLVMISSEGEMGLGYDTQHMPVAVARNGEVVNSSLTPKWIK